MTNLWTSEQILEAIRLLKGGRRSKRQLLSADSQEAIKQRPKRRGRARLRERSEGGDHRSMSSIPAPGQCTLPTIRDTLMSIADHLISQKKIDGLGNKFIEECMTRYDCWIKTQEKKLRTYLKQANPDQKLFTIFAEFQALDIPLDSQLEIQIDQLSQELGYSQRWSQHRSGEQLLLRDIRQCIPDKSKQDKHLESTHPDHWMKDENIDAIRNIDSEVFTFCTEVKRSEESYLFAAIFQKFNPASLTFNKGATIPRYVQVIIQQLKKSLYTQVFTLYDYKKSLTLLNDRDFTWDDVLDIRPNGESAQLVSEDSKRRKYRKALKAICMHTIRKRDQFQNSISHLSNEVQDWFNQEQHTSISPKGNIKRLKQSSSQAKSRLSQLKHFERFIFANKLLEMRSELVQALAPDIYGDDAESKRAKKSLTQALDFDHHIFKSTVLYQDHLKSESALKYLWQLVDCDITYLIFNQICSTRKK